MKSHWYASPGGSEMQAELYFNKFGIFRSWLAIHLRSFKHIVRSTLKSPLWCTLADMVTPWICTWYISLHFQTQESQAQELILTREVASDHQIPCLYFKSKWKEPCRLCSLLLLLPPVSQITVLHRALSITIISQWCILKIHWLTIYAIICQSPYVWISGLQPNTIFKLL